MEFIKEQCNTKPEKIQELIKGIRKIVGELYEKVTPEEVSKRRNVNKMKMSDVDIITMSIVGEMAGIDSERGWYAYCRKNFGDIFGKFCERSRYNRIRRNLHLVIGQIFNEIVSLLGMGDVAIVDSAPVPVCKFGRARFHKTYKGYGASYGKCASKKETYYGYKLHVVCSLEGYPVRYMLTSANTDDREPVAELSESLSLWALLADKGYIGRKFAQRLFDETGVHIFTPSRSNAKKPNMSRSLTKAVFKRRRRIETFFSQLSDHFNFQRVRAKSLWGLITRLNLKFLAYLLAVFLNKIFAFSDLCKVKHFFY
jgi:transposase